MLAGCSTTSSPTTSTAGASNGDAPANETVAELDKGAIAATIQTNASLFQDCYERALDQDPSLRGRISVDFAIAPDGTVTRADVLRDELGSPAFAGCIRAALLGLTFPPHAAAEPVTVTNAFVFEPSPPSESPVGQGREVRRPRRPDLDEK